MEEEFNKTPKKANRWFRAFIVLSLLYGATFSLNGFFNWIFFFAALYSLFMSYFLLPVQPKIFETRGSYSARQSPSSPPTSPQRRIGLIIGLSVFAFFFFILLVGVFSGGSDEESTSQPEEQPQEQEAEQSSPTSPESLTSRGNEFFNDQQYDSADMYYDMALALDDSYGEAIYGKGIVQYNKGNTDMAYSYFTRSYEGGYRFAWLSWVLADTYDKRGETMRAIELYKESVNLDSAYVDSYKRLAELVPNDRDKYLDLASRHATN